MCAFLYIKGELSYRIKAHDTLNVSALFLLRKLSKPLSSSSPKAKTCTYDFIFKKTKWSQKPQKWD